MRQVLDYNIHNIVKFRIVRNKRYDFGDLINLKFCSFQVDEVDKPDIVLNIGKFTPSNRDCYLIDYKYHIKDNYLYCQDSEGKVGWEFEISGLEHGDTVINFHVSKRFRPQSIVNLLYIPLFLPQILLLSIIEYKLSTKGYFLIHSGAISKDNQAYLLSGRAGCFKTTLCMEFVRRAGFTWLGDDRAILYQDKVLGFPMNSAAFEFVTRHLTDETHWGFLRQVHFAAEQLFSRHGKTDKREAKSAELKALLLIARSNRQRDDRRVTFDPLPQSHLEQIVNSLLISNRLEDFIGMAGLGINSGPFLKYMLAYSFVFPNSSIETREEKLAENLKNSLGEIPVYKVEIPVDYSLDIFKQIHEFIAEDCWR